MAKELLFEDPRYTGSTQQKPLLPFESIPISPGTHVSLWFKGKEVRVAVTAVDPGGVLHGRVLEIDRSTEGIQELAIDELVTFNRSRIGWIG